MTGNNLLKFISSRQRWWWQWCASQSRAVGPSPSFGLCPAATRCLPMILGQGCSTLSLSMLAVFLFEAEQQAHKIAEERPMEKLAEMPADWRLCKESSICAWSRLWRCLKKDQWNNLRQLNKVKIVLSICKNRLCAVSVKYTEQARRLLNRSLCSLPFALMPLESWAK